MLVVTKLLGLATATMDCSTAALEVSLEPDLYLDGFCPVDLSELTTATEHTVMCNVHRCMVWETVIRRPFDVLLKQVFYINL